MICFELATHITVMAVSFVRKDFIAKQTGAKIVENCLDLDIVIYDCIYDKLCLMLGKVRKEKMN